MGVGWGTAGKRSEAGGSEEGFAGGYCFALMAVGLPYLYCCSLVARIRALSYRNMMAEKR